MSTVDSITYAVSGYYDGSENNDTIYALGFGGDIVAKGGDDTIWLGSLAANVYAGDGNDTINGGAASLKIYDDGGNLTVNSGAAYSSIRKYDSGNVTFNGGSAYNTIVLRAGTYEEPKPNVWQQFIGEVISVIADGITSVVNAVGDFFDSMAMVFEQTFTTILNSVSSWNNFSNTLNQAFSGFVAFWTNAVKSFDSTKQWVEYSLYDAGTNLFAWNKFDAVAAATSQLTGTYAWADKVDFSASKFYFNDYDMALSYQYALDKMLFGGGYGANGSWQNASQWIIKGVDYAGVVFEDVAFRVRETSSTLWGAIDTNTTTVKQGTRTAAVLFRDRAAYYKYKYFEAAGIDNGLAADNTAGYSALTAWTPPAVEVVIATLSEAYLDWLANGDGSSVSQAYLRAFHAIATGKAYGEASNEEAVRALTQNYTYSLQRGASDAMDAFGKTYLPGELRAAMVDVFVKTDAEAFLRDWVAAGSGGTLAGKLNALAYTVLDAGLTHRVNQVNGSDLVGANYVDRFKAYMLGAEGVAARTAVHQAAYAQDLQNFSQRTGMDLAGALKLMGVSLVNGDPTVVAGAVDRLLRAYQANPSIGSTQAWVNAVNAASATGGDIWKGDDLYELETESGLYSLGVRLGGESWNGNPNYEIYADGKLVASGSVTWAVAASSKTAADWLNTDSAWQTVWFSVESLPSKVEVRLANDGWGGSLAADRNLFADKLYLSADQTKFVDFSKKDIDAAGTTAASAVSLPLQPTTTLGVRLGGEKYSGNPNYEIYADGVKVASGSVTWAVAASTKTAADWLSTDSAWQTVWFNVASRPARIEVRLTNDVYWQTDAADRNLFVDKLYLSTDPTDFISFTSKDIISNTAGASLSVPAATPRAAPVSLLSDAARAGLVASFVQGAMVDSTSLSLDLVATAKLLYGETRATSTTMGVRLGGEKYGGNPNYEIYADGVKVASGSVTWAVAASSKTAADWLSTDSAWQTVWFNVASRPAQIEVRYTNDVSWLGQTADQDRNLFVDKIFLSTDPTDFIAVTNKNVNAGGGTGNAAKVSIPSGLGTLIAAYESSAATNLVTNGSFEQSGDPNYGWQRTWSGTSGTMDRNAASLTGISAADGSVYYELASDKNATAYQDIATTAGRWYTLSFRYRPQTSDAAGNVLQVWWNGALLDTTIEDDGAWRTYRYRVQATGASTRLAFAAAGTSDGIGALIDDVRLGHGVDVIDYTINQALTANQYLGNVIRKHWEHQVGNPLIDAAAVLAALKTLNGDTAALKAVLATYANGYVETLIEEAAALANDGGKTLQALIAAYGSAAGDAGSDRSDGALVDTTPDTGTVYPAKSTHGDIVFNGAAGYNTLQNEFDYGDIRFKGGAGYNKLIRQGIAGDITFYGVAGGNVIRNKVTGDGDITGWMGGLYNEISRTGGASGDIKATLGGGYNTVKLEVGTGNLDLDIYGGTNAVSRTGSGNSNVVMGGRSNKYSDDGISRLAIASYGGYNQVTRTGTGTGFTKAVLGGASNTLTVKNQGAVQAELYGGYNVFTYTGSQHTDLILGGAYNSATVGDGGSDIAAYGTYNNIQTGSGVDHVTAYGAYSVIKTGGTTSPGTKDQVEAWGPFSDVDYQVNAGDGKSTDHSNGAGFVTKANSGKPQAKTQRLSSTDRATLNAYGVTDSAMAAPNVSGTGVEVSESETTARTSSASLTTEEKSSLQQEGVDTTQVESDMQTRQKQAAEAKPTADKPSSDIVRDVNGAYTTVTDLASDVENFNFESEIKKTLAKIGEAVVDRATVEMLNIVMTVNRTALDMKTLLLADERFRSMPMSPVKYIGPIVLDMNGNGTLDFIALGTGTGSSGSSAVSFDITGDGKKESVSWVGAVNGAADGILFYDKDNNPDTVNANEMVFADSASETDMAALARKYDTNKDKTLSGTELKGFYVWRDHDSDGQVDTGEVQSAQTLGITAIGVDTDHTNGAGFSAGNQIFRTNQFSMNGKSATVGDVAFNYLLNTADSGAAIIDWGAWGKFKDLQANYDNIYFGLGAANVAKFGVADDLVVAISFYNEINAGTGNNLVIAGGLANNITTGSGNDVVAAGGIGNYVDVGAGDDAVALTGLGNWIETGSGNDIVVATGLAGMPIGANIVRKSGDGNLSVVLLNTANVIYNKGNGNISGVMLGAANVMHKEGAGNVGMVMGGVINSLSQKGSRAGDNYLAIMLGALNVSTHIGEGNYNAYMLGAINVSTNISKGGQAKEIVVMTGVGNVHTTVGATRDSKYFMLGGFNVLTKVANNDRGTGVTWAIMGGASNVATLVTQASVNAAFIGGNNIVTRVGGTGDDDGFAAAFYGIYNVATNIADGADAVFMVGSNNLFTKVGDGNSIAVMLGTGNIFTKVGRGDNLLLMGGALGNLFTHVGAGNTLAILVAVSPKVAANVFTKWGNGDTAVMLLGMPKVGTTTFNANLFTQIGNGRTYAMAVGVFNMMIKVGHGDYNAGWGSSIDASGLPEVMNNNKKEDIASIISDGVTTGIDVLSPALDNPYFNVVMMGFGADNVMAEINLASMLNGYTDADGKPIDTLTFEEKQTSTLQLAIANKGFGNLMVKAGDGTYFSIGVSISSGGTATEAMNLLDYGRSMLQLNAEYAARLKQDMAKAVALWNKASSLERTAAYGLTGNIAVNIGDGDAYFVQYGDTNISVKVGDGGDKLIQYGQHNAHVRIGDAADTPIAATINGRRLGEGVMVSFGTYNLNFQLGKSNDLIIAVPRIGEMGDVIKGGWLPDIDISLTQAETKGGKALDGFGLLFLGGSATYYKDMWKNISRVPSVLKSLKNTKKITQTHVSHILVDKLRTGNAARATELKLMWKEAFGAVKQSANIIQGGQGSDIILVAGGANFVFGDTYASFLDISIGSLLTYDWQWITVQDFFSGFKKNATMERIALALQSVSSVAPAGFEAGMFMPKHSLGELFGLSYSGDGTISGDGPDWKELVDTVLSLISFEPSYSFGALNSLTATSIVSAIDFIPGTDVMEDKLKQGVGMGSFVDGLEEGGLDAYKDYANYNFDRLFKGMPVVSSFPHLGFLAYLFSDIPDLATMIFAEASDDLIDYFTRQLNLLSGDGDLIIARGDANFLFGGLDDDLLLSIGRMTRAYGGAGDDIAVIMGDYNAFHGNSGNNMALVVGRDNLVFGGDDDDMLFAIGNKNHVVGSGGNDVLAIIGKSNRALANAGNDVIIVIGNSNVIFGGANDDFALVVGYSNIFYTGSGTDTIINFGNTRTAGYLGIYDADGKTSNAGTIVAKADDGGDDGDKYYRTAVGSYVDYQGGNGVDTVVMFGTGDTIDGGGGGDAFVLGYGARVDRLRTDSDATLLLGDLAGYGGQKIGTPEIATWFKFTKNADDLNIAIANLLGLGKASVEIDNVYAMLEAEIYRPNVVLSYWAADTNALKTAWANASKTQANFTFTYDTMYVSGTDLYEFIKAGRSDWSSIVKFGSASQGTGFTLTHTTKMNVGLGFMGGNGADALGGTAGDDVIAGGSGNDTFAGDAGDDWLLGNGGDDNFSVGLGNDTINGGAGNDTVNYTGLAALYGLTDSAVKISVVKGGAATTVRAVRIADGSVLKSDVLIDVDRTTFSLSQNVTYSNNLAPEFLNSNVAIVYENMQTAITLQAFDFEGDTIYYRIVGGADAALFELDGDLLSFKAAPNWEAPASSKASNSYHLLVSALDQNGGISYQTLVVYVNDANDAPSFALGASTAVTIGNLQAYVTTVKATDEDAADTVSYSIVEGYNADLFTIDATTGILSFKSAPAYSSIAGANDYVVDVQASDANQGLARQRITVSVTSGNTAPKLAVTRSVSVAENQKTVATIAASDTDTRSYSIVGGADQALFTIDAASGVLSFVTAPNYESPGDTGKDNGYVVVVQASDTTGAAVRQTVNVAVTNANEAPVITSAATHTVPKNMLTVTTVTASDEDQEDKLSFSISGGTNASLFNINATTGVLSFRAAPSSALTGTSYAVQVKVTDSKNMSTLQTLSVSVGDANTTPTIAATRSVSVAENQKTVAKIAASDSDTLSYSIVGGADQALFTIDAVSGMLSFGSAPDYELPGDADKNNTYLVTVQASDGKTGYARQALTVTVTNANDAPVITSGSVNTVIQGTFGANTLTGDANNNIFMPGKGNDTVGGRGGSDTVSYANMTSGFFVDLSAKSWSGAYNAMSDTSSGLIGLAGPLAAYQPYTASLYSIENIIGTEYADLLIGTTEANIIEGGGGDDRMIGRGGGDIFRFVQSATRSFGDDTVFLDYVEGDGDTLAFERSDLTVQQMWFTRDNTDLTIGFVGRNDSVTLIDWFAGARADSITLNQSYAISADAIDKLVAPMANAAHAISGGVTGSAYLGANPTMANTSLATAVGSSWTATTAATIIYDITPTMVEGRTVATTVKATDQDKNAVSYSIVASATDDSKFFTINSSTGVLSFASAPKFDLPQDTDRNNTYVVTVQASDTYGAYSRQQLVISVLNSRDTLLDAADAVSVLEKRRSVVTVTPNTTDGRAITYSIVGGDDMALFKIDSTTGLLSFKSAPDYELPTDKDKNNVYAVIVQASDTRGNTSKQQLSIAVEDINDTIAIPDLTSSVIMGTAGDDSMTGTALGNVFRPVGGNDSINGMDGSDTVSYVDATEGFYITILDVGGFARPLATATDRNAATNTRAYLTSIENMVGTAHIDKLVGNNNNNFMQPGAGKDNVYGMGGYDTVSYADMGEAYIVYLPDDANPDIVGYSKTVSSTVRGNEDRLFYIENVIGTNYNDRLYGVASANIIIGGAGDDTLAGNGGGDTYHFVKSGTGTSFGSDTISQTGAEDDGDTISIAGTDLSTQNLWFSKNGNDLLVEFVGRNDSVRVKDWYAGTGARVDYLTVNQSKTIDIAGIEQLVTKMASVIASYGGDVTGSDYAGLNPNTNNTELVSLAASYWH